MFKKVIIKELDNMERNGGTRNLTFKERKALGELKKDQTIVIKPANKDSGMVIIDKGDYNEEMEIILSDHETYKKLHLDPTNNYHKALENLLLTAKEKNILSDKEFDYFNVSFPRIPVIYYLPKVHKDIHNAPGCPIVSGINFLKVDS